MPGPRPLRRGEKLVLPSAPTGPSAVPLPRPKQVEVAVTVKR